MEKIKYFKPREMSESSKLNFKQILKGVVFATVIALICLLVAAFVFTYTNISMSLVKLISNVIFYAAAFSGGVIASYKQKSYGWLHGALAGVIYALMIFFISILSDASGVKMYLPFTKIFLGAILGAAGGIVGVNVRTGKGKKR